MGSSVSSYSRNYTIVRINEDKSVTTLVPTTTLSGSDGGNPKILTIKDNYLYYMLHTAGEYTNQINIYSVNLETFENKKIKTLYLDYDKYKFYSSNYFNYSNVDSCIIIDSISGAQGNIVTIDFDNNYALNITPCYGTRVYNNNYFWRNNLLYRKDLDVNKSIGGTINFINLAGNKIIINNILYNLDSDLNVGSQIKDMTTDPNYIKDSIILSVNNTNMYVMGKLDSTSYISNTANGKLCNFNEITNQFEVIYQIKAPVMQKGNYRSGCQTCFISEDGEVCYVEPVVDYTAVIGYTLYGRNFYFTQPVTLQSDKVLNDYIVYNESLDTVRGSMPDNGALNYTPSTSQQTIPLGYTSGGTIAAVDSTIDENIIADNIKKDITILGVTGTLEEGIDTSDATAAASDIVENKTAYVNGVKLTGTIKNTSYQNEFEANAIAMDGGYNNSTVLTYELIPTNDIVIRSNNDACYVYATEDDVATAIGLTADVIKQGETVLGVTGTYEGSGEDLNETIIGQENIITNLKALVNRKSEPVYDVADADVYGDTLILSDGQIEKPYTELKYVQSTGTQYIDTNINGSGNLRIEMMFSNWNASMDGFLCGSRTSADLNTFCIYYHGVGNPKYIRCDYDTTTNEAAQVNITNSIGMYYIDKNKNVTTVKDLVLNTTLTNTLTYNNFENNLAIYIFSRNNNGEAQAFTSYYLYYFKIYDDDVLVRDFIPVQRKSDSEVCLYDKVSNTFFINQGTGAFIAGPEI